MTAKWAIETVEAANAAGNPSPHDYRQDVILEHTRQAVIQQLTGGYEPQNEAILTTMGMTLLTWGFWVMQSKAIEHGGKPMKEWETFLRDQVIAQLDQLLLDARNQARDGKIEQLKDTGWELIPPPFRDWHDDPAGKR